MNQLYINELNNYSFMYIPILQNMVVLSLKDRKNKMNPAYVPDEMEASSISSCREYMYVYLIGYNFEA